MLDGLRAVLQRGHLQGSDQEDVADDPGQKTPLERNPSADIRKAPRPGWPAIVAWPVKGLGPAFDRHPETVAKRRVEKRWRLHAGLPESSWVVLPLSGSPSGFVFCIGCCMAKLQAL